MRLFAFAALLACTLSAAGCKLDMVEVPFNGRMVQPAFLDLNLRHSRDSLTLSVFFYPGADRNGETREIADDALRVDGRVVDPTEINSSGSRSYRILDLGAGATPVQIRPPAMSAVGWPTEIEVWPLRVDPTRPATVAPDGALEVSVVGLADPLAPAFGYWRADFTATGCAGPSFLSLSASTPPPPTLRIPLDYLPESEPPLAVRYGGHAEHRIEHGGPYAEDAYHIRISRSFDSCLEVPAAGSASVDRETASAR